MRRGSMKKGVASHHQYMEILQSFFLFFPLFVKEQLRQNLYRESCGYAVAFCQTADF